MREHEHLYQNLAGAFYFKGWMTMSIESWARAKKEANVCRQERLFYNYNNK